MIVLSKTGGVASTNCFLIGDEETKQAVLFDAPDHTVEPLLHEVERHGLDLIGLWFTHGHFDHFADHAVARKRFPGAKALIHQLDEFKVRNPNHELGLFGLSFLIPPLQPDGHLSDKQKLKIGNLDIEVLHTPGHSPGHVSFYFPVENLLIGGDLIIGGSIGRTDLPDSNHEEMENSIRRVMELRASTRLLGGHGDPSTIGEERKSNPFVQEILRTEAFR
jgi:glyoxylase-like metal-dependent hydrolase (beta-lactamase superfamily II)